MKRRTTVLGYIRLSDGEEEAGSPARQEAAIQSWAATHHFERVELYQDIIGKHSGKRDSGRPEWQKLKERSHHSDVTAVVVETVSRLYRNLKLLLIFVDELTERGVRFVSVSENFDFKPPDEADNPLEAAMRRMALQQFGALAEAWSNFTSAKMTIHVRGKRTTGKHWGTVPFGCVRNTEHKLEPHPIDHPALERLYELYGRGFFGWASIAELLNREGFSYRNRNGEQRAFNRDDIRRCIELHLTYRGHLTRGHRELAEVMVPNAWQPIISIELIEQVGKVVESRRKRQQTPERKYVYALTPLLYCSACGATLTGQAERRSSKRFYRHMRKGDCKAYVGQIEAEKVELITAKLISDMTLPVISWPQLKEILEEELSEDDSEERAKLTELEQRRERTKQMFEEQFLRGGQIWSWEEFQGKIALLNEDIAKLQTELKTKQPDFFEMQEVLRRLADLEGLIKKAGLRTQKEIFASFFERIDIDLTTSEISSYKTAEWVGVYIDAVIRYARRDSNPHGLNGH